jgi:hypothetical protein
LWQDGSEVHISAADMTQNEGMTLKQDAVNHKGDEEQEEEELIEWYEPDCKLTIAIIAGHATDCCSLQYGTSTRADRRDTRTRSSRARYSRRAGRR